MVCREWKMALTTIYTEKYKDTFYRFEDVDGLDEFPYCAYKERYTRIHKIVSNIREFECSKSICLSQVKSWHAASSQLIEAEIVKQRVSDLYKSMFPETIRGIIRYVSFAEPFQNPFFVPEQAKHESKGYTCKYSSEVGLYPTPVTKHRTPMIFSMSYFLCYHTKVEKIRVAATYQGYHQKICSIQSVNGKYRWMLDLETLEELHEQLFGEDLDGYFEHFMEWILTILLANEIFCVSRHLVTTVLKCVERETNEWMEEREEPELIISFDIK
jgi:hypothetical protein